MHSFTFYLTIMVSSLWLGLSQAGRSSLSFEPSIKIARTITVDPAGNGDCTKVQQAIDSIPPNNKEWVRIALKGNTYTEKVVVPENKQYILLEGEGRDNTIIVWNEPRSGSQDATFAVLGGDFIAAKIQFRNSYNQPMPEDGDWDDSGPLTWTTAAFVGGDRVSFYNCSFYGQQDTLNDAKGRHYFDSCYIEGLVDFICGNGQSIYQNCQIFINTKPRPRSTGYITAQGRESENDTTGFVFNSGYVSGNGKAYLGRAYRQYSRVLFHNTQFDNVIPPVGWRAWHFVGNEEPITFAEEGCTGPGAKTSKRVKWEKKLSPQELDMLTNPTIFIDQDGWLKGQLRTI